MDFVEYVTVLAHDSKERPAPGQGESGLNEAA